VNDHFIVQNIPAPGVHVNYLENPGSTDARNRWKCQFFFLFRPITGEVLNSSRASSRESRDRRAEVFRKR
jgi:hypothetical protein